MAEVNPSIAIYFFVAVFAAYYYYKYSKKNVVSNGVIFVFASILLVGEYFINVGMSKDICGYDQYMNAAFATFIPWLLIFGALKMALVVFPGWLKPFSNTFGYLFVGATTNMKDVFQQILTPQFDLDPNSGKALQKDEPGNDVANKKDIGRALEQIYSDQSVVLNELTLDNIERFWNSFKQSKLIRPSATTDQLEELKTFLILKDIVAEFVWCVLAGFLIVSISYNFLLNASCKYTPDQLKERAKRAEELQKAHDAEANKKKNNILKIGG